MSTLLIELRGPQQAWGSHSRFATRATELAPTRSGVIGLLAAALGYERTASLERFTALRFGVRIDQPGTLERDFQTTRSLDGSTAFPLSQRFYLADAVFLVGLELPDERELRAFRDALARPYYPLFLGRRAFPPDGPVRTEIVTESLEPALLAASWRARSHYQRRLRREATPPSSPPRGRRGPTRRGGGGGARPSLSSWCSMLGPGIRLGRAGGMCR